MVTVQSVSYTHLDVYKRQEYVDFAAEMGWQYQLLDEGWMVPYERTENKEDVYKRQIKKDMQKTNKYFFLASKYTKKRIFLQIY